MSCQYKNMFGQVKQGIHSYRIFDFAVLDIAVTVVIAWGISYFLKTPFIYTTIAFFLLGIVVHRLFCVRTTMDKILFP